MNHYFTYSPTNKRKIIYSITDLPTSDADYQFTIPTELSPEEWDNELERPKNIYLKKHKAFFNNLNEIKIAVSNYLKTKEQQKESVSKMVINKMINKILVNGSPLHIKKNTLLYYTEQYIAQRQDFIQPTTLMRYHVFCRLLKWFEGYQCKRYMLQDINARFVKDFTHFCKQEEYSENTIYRSLHFYKTILNFVESKGIKTSIRELNIKREKQQRDIVTLDEEEIRRIKETEVPKELEDAKDWLLISCYTGQRVSDFMNFTKEQITKVSGKLCLTFCQKKTKKTIILPLHPVVKQLIKKRKGFPKKFSIKQYNRSIKQIAEISGINNEIKTSKRINFRVKKGSLKKCKTLSSHIGRRSFATLFYGKIPTPILMMATGHSSENTLLKYIDHLNTDKIKYLSEMFENDFRRKEKWQ